jgi:rhamnogalacturonyl hydrolase YesR
LRNLAVAATLAATLLAGCGSSEPELGNAAGGGGYSAVAGSSAGAMPGVAGMLGGAGVGGISAAAGSGAAISGGPGATSGSAGAGGAGGAGGAHAAGDGGRDVGGGGNSAGAGGRAPVVDRDATVSLMKRVADYELSRFASSPTNRNWARAVFYTGALATYRASGDMKYLSAARSWGDTNDWALGTDGNGRPLSPADNTRFADNQACIQTYAELYIETPLAAMLGPATASIDAMIAKPVAGRTEWWWCDALFMAPPALARVAKALDRPQYLSLMHTLFSDAKAHLYSPEQHLFYRDSSFFDTNTFWSRGNGWVVAGLARILEFVPADDPRRADYEALLREMAEKLRTLQQADGFWRSDLLNPNAYPNRESSGTAFFCYGMAWGINNGVLDRATFLEPVTRAWKALTGVVSDEGRLGWVQAVGSKPGPATADSTNDYATGALLLSGEQLLKL